MKLYVKPSIEVVELSMKENIAYVQMNNDATRNFKSGAAGSNGMPAINFKYSLGAPVGGAGGGAGAGGGLGDVGSGGGTIPGILGS